MLTVCAFSALSCVLTNLQGFHRIRHSIPLFRGVSYCVRTAPRLDPEYVGFVLRRNWCRHAAWHLL